MHMYTTDWLEPICSKGSMSGVLLRLQVYSDVARVLLRAFSEVF